MGWPQEFHPVYFIKSNVLGLMFSLALWGLYFYDGFYYSTGGANIGLGILLLLSPAFLFFIMWIHYHWKKGGRMPSLF
jgi:hypothetical protein